MKSLRTRVHRPLMATATVLLVATGCSQNPPPLDTGAVPLARTDGPKSDILEREDLTFKVTSMADLLTNRIPGVVIRRSRGHSWVEIRGPGTISSSTEALIVVDGIENSSRGLLAMNPEDVQRIQVLKGASAAIYGVRGANGVLVVTTRRYGQ